MVLNVAAPVTVAMSVTLAPGAMELAEAESAVVVEYCVTTGVLPYVFSNSTLPARMSGLPSLFRSMAIDCPLLPILMRSFGMMLLLKGTDVKVPSPLP
jgi:hypothetical protein